MSAPAAPRISIVVATRNSAATLGRFLDSVRTQTRRPHELIVIDGGSKDGTVDMLRRSEDVVTTWLSETDGGLYEAWNKALAICSGDWVCFIGSDDHLWQPDVLERFAARLVSVPPDVAVVYAKVALVNRAGDIIQVYGESWDRARSRFAQNMSIPHPGTMHRRSLFERNGTFDPSFQYAGDYELLLRELPAHDAAFAGDLVVVGMRWGGRTSTPEGMRRSLREVRRAQKKHGIGPSLNWVSLYAVAVLRCWLFLLLGEATARRAMDALRKAAGKRPFWTLAD